MLRQLKNITSILLLLVFLFPTIVISEHHHEHFVCKAKNEKHFHELHDKCAICSFEFSIYTSVKEEIVLQKDKPLVYYYSNYNSPYFYNHSAYSFLLRAPPIYTSEV